MSRRIDLRSDTLTRPTGAMREAMAQAEVGDDVFGEDPTVNALEASAAARMGKAAGLFVPSGTMGNLAAVLAHCERGAEILLGELGHTFLYEAGGPAVLGGVHPRPLHNQPDGTIALEDLEGAIRVDNVHFPRTRLILLENSHNRRGGAVLPEGYMAGVRRLADRHGLRVHLDGARIFNAAVASGKAPAELAACADSVTFCLSKGLAAPVGSVLCGDEAFIGEARRARKILGGGMRQAGVLAAAGLVALDTMVDRLADDHANARRLAEGLAALPAVELDPATVQTNIVIFGLNGESPDDLIRGLAEHDVHILAIGGNRLRAVTHYEVTSDMIDQALRAFRRVLD